MNGLVKQVNRRNGQYRRSYSMANTFGLLLLLFLLPEAVTGQSVLGRVVDLKTGQSIPYALIWLQSGGASTLSDEFGRYALSLAGVQAEDSVSVSVLGFQPACLPVRALREVSGEFEIGLYPVTYDLPEVTVLDNGRKDAWETIGYPDTKSRMVVTGWSNITRTEKIVNIGERGTLIEKGKERHLLKTLNFHLAKNGYDSVAFRLHLYSVGEQGKPGKELVDRSIIVKATMKRGWVRADLSGYQIVVEEPFIATLEWVDAWGRSCRSSRGSCPLLLSANKKRGTLYGKDIFDEDWLVLSNWHLGIFFEAIDISKF